MERGGVTKRVVSRMVWTESPTVAMFGGLGFGIPGGV